MCRGGGGGGGDGDVANQEGRRDKADRLVPPTQEPARGTAAACPWGSRRGGLWHTQHRSRSPPLRGPPRRPCPKSPLTASVSLLQSVSHHQKHVSVVFIMSSPLDCKIHWAGTIPQSPGTWHLTWLASAVEKSSCKLAPSESLLGAGSWSKESTWINQPAFTRLPE